jgi:hypothetical protein
MSTDISNPTLLILIVVLVLLVAFAIAIYLLQRKKTRSIALRRQFGAEYERELAQQGSLKKTESALAARQARVEKLALHPLATAQRDRFVADWQNVQSRFVDHPKGSLIEADELITSLMQARGYPVDGFDRSAEYISVSHPGVVEHYRSAHAIAARPSSSEASTEELRSAMIEYRTLFDELVQTPAA